MIGDLEGKPVLVTGAAGCIGSWVLKILLESGALPVVYDLSQNKFRLNLISENADTVDWVQGDITDYDQVINVMQSNDIYAVIHLAALQVPFAKADPIKGTHVNVLGTAHILEACRQLGISRLSFASSVAAPAMGENEFLATLYGAHKICNEQMAAVYWQDWQVPSVCIRPGVIYGPGRDQGMSAAPTIAMLAAFANLPYNIPFSGPVSFIHAEDAARRFIGAIAHETEGAHIFDMDGVCIDMADVLKAIAGAFAKNRISVIGAPLPFPAGPDDGKLDAFLGLSPHRPFDRGVRDTLDGFKRAMDRKVLTQDMIVELIGKNS